MGPLLLVGPGSGRSTLARLCWGLECAEVRRVGLVFLQRALAPGDFSEMMGKRWHPRG